ncbi:MAG: AzlC family ABC transporter permease [Thermodesulfobacteriota bacterium]
MVSDRLDVKKAWIKAIRDGLSAAWPICLGYVAIGLAFGVVARNAGLRPLEIGLMSLIVYAGSSQFIAAAMLGAEAGFPSIVLTTFSINLRHLLMSSSLSPYLRNLSGSRLSLFAYGVTDESFALNMSRFQSGQWGWRQAMVVNHSTNLTWILSTVAGGIGGAFIPAGAFGIDYALTAMFICLLVFQLRSIRHILVALLSGILAVVLSLSIPGNSHILIAAFVSASAGMLYRKRVRCRGTAGGNP